MNHIESDAPVRFSVRSHDIAGPLPHYWTKCVGSCHAATALREDWRAQLTRCRKELGFEPRIAFAEGLAAAWDWFRKKGI